MTLQEIETSLKNGEYANNPHGAAEAKGWLAGEYSWVMGQLENILRTKPAIWNELRTKYKSDKATDRAYEATEDGVNEVILRMRLKKMEKLSAAMSTYIRLAEGEAKNQF